jgi:anti-sigma B factor antagonist/stage II sporulation protein AA (anti-sigma F factor antagonist)
MEERANTKRTGVDQSRRARAYSIEELEAPAGIVALALSGEFDLATVPHAHERLEQARARGVRGVALDLSEVTFADSAALREVLRADAALRGDGARLVLAAISPAVERLLDLTRARELLDVAPTLDQAITRLAEPR